MPDFGAVKAPRIVPGEEELGPQMECAICGMEWPACDPDFWRRKNGYWSSRCLACWIDYYAEMRVRHRTQRERAGVAS